MKRLAASVGLATALTIGACTALVPAWPAAVAAQELGEAPPEEDPAIVEARMAVRRRDFEGAVQLWRRAAARGNHEAEYRLGVAHRSGQGVPKDLDEAVRWFRAGAEGGDDDARFALAMLLRDGRGVARDRDEAIRLLELAARAGHREARQQLKELRESGAVAYSAAASRVRAHRLDPRAALEQSIRVGDPGSAREALARGAPIDGAPGDDQHWRPLLLAIDQDQPDLVRLLLDHRASPGVRSRAGEPALIEAVRAGNRKIVRMLLAAGAPADERAASGYTALMVAAQAGRADLARDLIGAGADVRVTLDDGSSAASVARRFGHVDLHRDLVRRGSPTTVGPSPAAALALAGAGAKGDDVTMPPLVEAARRGDATLVGQLLDRGARSDVHDSGGETALTRAAAGGYVEVVRALLAAGAAVDAPGAGGTTASMQAMGSTEPGADAVFALLLRAGASPHARDGMGRAVVDFASAGASPAKLDALREAGGSWTAASIGAALSEASAAGRRGVAEALLGQVERDEDVVRALCRAIEQGQREIESLLLSRGAFANGDCGDARTPLSVAARQGDAALVERLLGAGADPARAPEGQDTALIAAASRGHLAIVERLLEAGADVNRRGARRMTALMAAASNDHVEVVERLLAAGADRGMRSDTDHTALEIARQAGAETSAERIESRRPGLRGWLPGGAR
ncbi:MAG: ankyrin repeat domain-containing protein [Spirochaetaceae bacterium]|nr:ankyrin repeat domain-containing protein [Spirochaetaceae bacterium]